MSISSQDILTALVSQANPDNVAGMARYGINPQGTLGISMPTLRAIARMTGKDHALALELWDSRLHEARILAGLVDDPLQVDEPQMERWVAEFDSWDICDQVCSSLFEATRFAWAKALEWPCRPEEFVKRAGFVLMAVLAVHRKKAVDSDFEPFFSLILSEAGDDRNFVRKAVNWALRSLGKRSLALNRRALEVSAQVALNESKTARWIAADAIRELSSEKVQSRLKARSA